jgi:alanyl-tRNA synthetase
VTGPGAFRYFSEIEERAHEAAGVLRTQPDHLVQRAEQLLAERESLETLLDELRQGGGAGESLVRDTSIEAKGQAVVYRAVRLKARDADDARAWGDGFLSSEKSGVAVVAAEFPEDKRSFFAFVSDDLIGRGIRADAVVRAVAEVTGGRGGGKPHMAQAGVGDPSKIDEALETGESVVRRLAQGAG